MPYPRFFFRSLQLPCHSQPQSECPLIASHSLGPSHRYTHVILTPAGSGAIILIPTLQRWKLRFRRSPSFTLPEGIRTEFKPSARDFFVAFHGLALLLLGFQGPHPALLLAIGLCVVPTHPVSS